MSKSANNRRFGVSVLSQAQLGDTFLSSKHLDYMAAIAEFSRLERV